MPKFLGSGSKPASSKLYTFRLMTSQAISLDRLRDLTGVPVAEQIRRGIDLWIAKQRRAK